MLPYKSNKRKRFFKNSRHFNKNVGFIIQILNFCMDFCLKLALSQNHTANLFSAKITKKKSLHFEQ